MTSRASRGPDGTAYVADAANNRVDVIVGDTLSPGWGGTGSGNGQFDDPRGLVTNWRADLYVADYDGGTNPSQATPVPIQAGTLTTADAELEDT